MRGHQVLPRAGAAARPHHIAQARLSREAVMCVQAHLFEGLQAYARRDAHKD